MKRNAWLLFVWVALQVAWIGGTVAREESLLRQGAVVLFETAPVDPRDLLRGDYVILNYPFSSVPRSLFGEDTATSLAPGAKVYLRMEKRGDYYVPGAASRTPFPIEADRPMLRGEVLGQWDSDAGTNQTVRLRFGLERYYVREGTGEPQGKLTVEAVLSRSGRALIRQVYIDGKPYSEAMKSTPAP